MAEHAETGIGATLREAREAQGRSQQDVAQALRARVGQVQALEDEEFSGFGGEVYVRGFLRSYATEVGLDAAWVMEAYTQEYGGDQPPASTLVRAGGLAAPKVRERSSPAWLMWLLVAVVAVIATVVFASIGDGRAPEQAGDDDVGTPPSSAPTDDEDPDQAADADAEGDGAAGDDGQPDEDPDDGPDEDPDDGADEGPDDADDDEADPRGVELVIALEEASWMRIVVDGSVVLEETVAAGETRQFSGDEVEARFGNAGGVYAELNGEDLGVQGSRGEVADVVFTAQGAERQ